MEIINHDRMTHEKRCVNCQYEDKTADQICPNCQCRLITVTYSSLGKVTDPPRRITPTFEEEAQAYSSDPGRLRDKFREFRGDKWR